LANETNQVKNKSRSFDSAASKNSLAKNNRRSFTSFRMTIRLQIPHFVQDDDLLYEPALDSGLDPSTGASMLNRRFMILSTLLAASLAVAAQSPATLKDAYKGAFHVGVAINFAQITGADAVGDALIARQFDSISPENALKWVIVHPRQGTYSFDLADKYVAFGEKNHMFIVGHNLVWHNQVPAWVFQDEQGKQVTREVLLQRMHEHIATVVGRYKGRIQSWDVVNEALADDGTLRKSKWLEIIGEDYLVKAYQWAHEADPQAELNYNDYALEVPAKRAGAIALIKKLQAAGIPIAVVGNQAHVRLDWPSAEQEERTVKELASAGVKVAITELDVDVLPGVAPGSAEVSLHMAQDPKLNPYPNGLPEAVQKDLAREYALLFGVYLKNRAVMSRVTVWGLTDADSWRNNWPVEGRTDDCLLFDRNDQPKPAFFAVIEEAGKAQK
jgi:endo-1,4-beta-xylanase